VLNNNRGWNRRSTFPGAGGEGFRWSLRIGRPTATTSDAGELPLPSEPGRFVRSEKMARLEAALFVAQDALPARRLAHVATLADATEARTLIKRLNEIYDTAGTAFRIERVAAGYQLLTRPEYALWLGKLHHRQAELKLSPSAMETLAIVAYRQPVTRADVEAIRGVQSSEMLKQLMERNLVRVAGHEDSLGRPFLYGTTRRFLEVFGFQNVDELPMAERLRIQKTEKESPDPAEEPEIAGAIGPSEETEEVDIKQSA